MSGAFTGARARASGLVAEAENGTLFLDEVDALPLANQVKLPPLIAQKEYRVRESRGPARPTCGSSPPPTRTSSPKSKRGASGGPLFRLRVLPLEVPALKDWPEDIPVFLEHFLTRYSAEYGKAPVRFTQRAMDHLRDECPATSASWRTACAMCCARTRAPP